MKKKFRIILGKKVGRKGHTLLTSRIITAKTHYGDAMRALDDTNKEELRSLAAITARLSKVSS